MSIQLLILLDDLIKEAAGVFSLDLLLDPPVGGKVCDVTFVGKACAAGEDSDDATIPGEDDRPRVASMRKLAAPLVVGQDGDFDRGVFDAVIIVDAGEGLETISATDGGSRGQTVLHNE